MCAFQLQVGRPISKPELEKMLFKLAKVQVSPHVSVGDRAIYNIPYVVYHMSNKGHLTVVCE